MKVSVVMSTYNGSKYIINQMESLRKQTESIDEVIIIDDCSKDNTVELIEKYIKKYKLVNWKLQKNITNCGYIKNFYNGFKMAAGDLIFPCDQDDFWHNDKIKIMKKVMESNSEIFVLEGQPHRWFQENVFSGENLKQKLRNGIVRLLDRQEIKKENCKNTKKVHLIEFDRRFIKTWPGCVLGIRKDFFEKIQSYWFDDIPHDTFVSFYAKVMRHYYKLDYHVIEWRKHASSVTQSVKKTKEERIKELIVENKRVEHLLCFAEENSLDDRCTAIIKKAIKYYQLRKRLVQKGDIFCAVLLIKYKQFYPQFRRYFTDLKYALQKNK